MTDATEGSGPHATQHLLSTAALDIGYSDPRRTHTIARQLELNLRAGEFVCLLGPNGAGKSTLIRTLAGMQAPLRGALQVQGQAFEGMACA